MNDGSSLYGGEVSDAISKLKERQSLADHFKALPVDKSEHQALLTAPLSFFSSFLCLQRGQKEDILERELVNFHKARAVALADELLLRQTENEATKFMLEEGLKEEARLNKGVEKLNN